MWPETSCTRDGKFGVRNGTFGFNVLGTSRLGVSVKARDSLGSGSWTQVGAATLDETGTFYFSDAATKDYTRRFYTVSAVSFAGLPLYPWSN